MTSYCPKCCQHFFAHNDDGSCVDDLTEAEIAEENRDYGDEEEYRRHQLQEQLIRQAEHELVHLPADY